MAEGVAIRPYSAQSHREMVLGWFADPCFFFNTSKKPSLLTPSEVDGALAKTNMPLYILEGDGQPVGLASFGLTGLRHRSTSFEARLAPLPPQTLPRGVEAARAAVEAAFATLPVRRLIALTLAFDLAGRWLFEALGFESCGCRPQAVFASGRYWDLVYYILDRPRAKRPLPAAGRRLPPPPERPVAEGFAPPGAAGVTPRGVRPGDEALLRDAGFGRGLLVPPSPHAHRDVGRDVLGRAQPPVWAPLAGGPPPAGSTRLVLEQAGRAVGVMDLDELDQAGMRARLSVWAAGGRPEALLQAACDYCFGWANLHRVYGLLWAGDDPAAAENAGFTGEGVLRRAAFADGRSRDVRVMARLRPEPPAAVPGGAPESRAGQAGYATAGGGDAAAQGAEAAAEVRPLDQQDLDAARALFDDEGFFFGTLQPATLPHGLLMALLDKPGSRYGLWLDGRLVGLAAAIKCPDFPSAEVWLRLARGVPAPARAATARRLAAMLVDYQNCTRLHAVVPAFDTAAVEMYSQGGFELEARLREHFFRRGRWHDALVFGICGPRVPGEE